MTRSEILALAECVEKLEGPSADIFIEAFGITFPKNYMPGRSGFGPSRWETFKRLIDAGAWLDAAMTLVPEGWLVGTQGELPFPDKADMPFFCILRPREWGRALNVSAMDAATPALALCAAALRAIAQEMPDGE